MNTPCLDHNFCNCKQSLSFSKHLSNEHSLHFFPHRFCVCRHVGAFLKVCGGIFAEVVGLLQWGGNSLGAGVQGVCPLVPWGCQRTVDSTPCTPCMLFSAKFFEKKLNNQCRTQRKNKKQSNFIQGRTVSRTPCISIPHTPTAGNATGCFHGHIFSCYKPLSFCSFMSMRTRALE